MHWEYQSLSLLQVEPDWQQVAPENPLPPPRKIKLACILHILSKKGILTLSPLGSAVSSGLSWSWGWDWSGGGSWDISGRRDDGSGGRRDDGRGDRTSGGDWVSRATSEASSERA